MMVDESASKTSSFCHSRFHIRTDGIPSLKASQWVLLAQRREHLIVSPKETSEVRDRSTKAEIRLQKRNGCWERNYDTTPIFSAFFCFVVLQRASLLNLI